MAIYKVTLYPRFLLTFSKNKYNTTRFYNDEFLRAGKITNRRLEMYILEAAFLGPRTIFFVRVLQTIFFSIPEK